MSTDKLSVADFKKLSEGHFPGLLGIHVLSVEPGETSAYFEVKQSLLAGNGYLHAGSVVTLADTCAGYGCVANLPEGASGFTTIELKSNHLGTAREGIVECTAKLVHGGRQTQVWDAVVRDQKTAKTLALFRCTQMILYPK
jgi:uncharacterized protein (TIGR00369 family)